MTEVNENTEVPSNTPDELTTLKNRARLMGVPFSPNIGLATLKIRVDEAITGQIPDKPEDVLTPEETPKVEAVKPRTWLTHEEFVAEQRAHNHSISNRLVRIVVTCNNPLKREWEGDIFSVGSAKKGTFKKFVPFNNQAGYHVPYIIYTEIEAKMYTYFYNTKGSRGEKIRKGKFAKEFNVEVLPPLTAKELAALKQRQLAANTIDSE